MSVLPQKMILVLMAAACLSLAAGCSHNPPVTPVQVSAAPAPQNARTSAVADDANRQIYIVRLQAAPLANYTGGINGLAATDPQVTGAKTLDLDSPASRAYLQYLKAQQAQFIAAMDAALGRKVAPVFIYYYAMNGMAIRLTSAEAARVAKLSGVVSVRSNRAYKPLAPESRPQK